MDILNIDNYSNDDLKQFLKLDMNNFVNIDTINKKADDLIDKLILSNPNSDAKEKKDMLKFINQVRNKLIGNQVLGPPSLGLLNPGPGPSVLKHSPFNEFSSPAYSKEPHFVQNTYAVNKRSPNQIDIPYRTRLCVFNTIFSDEFLTETAPQTLNGDVTGAIDFTFPLVNPIKNVIGMSLSALQYPNVQPTFSIQKNNIYMFVAVHGGGPQAVVQMSNGYFTAATFAPILERNINFALYNSYVTPNLNMYGQVETPNFNNAFAVVANPNTNRITIMNTNNADFTMIFDMPVWDNGYTVYDASANEFIPNVCGQKSPYQSELPLYYANNKLQPNSLGFQMGFRNTVYQEPYQDAQLNPALNGSNMGGQPLVYSPVKSYTTESQYNDANGGYIYFCVNEFNNNRLDDVTGIFQNSFFDNNILALVPVTSPHFTNTLDTGADFIFKARNYTGPVDINRIVVSLYDANGIKISFNQYPFAFALEFKILYDNPPTMESLKAPY